MTETKQHRDGPVHMWFGLSHSNYLVLPRALMQSMPTDWQQRMVACLDDDELAEWEAEHEDHAGPTYYRDGDEVEAAEIVLLPTTDPVPHYNRGRTYIEPKTAASFPLPQEVRGAHRPLT